MRQLSLISLSIYNYLLAYIPTFFLRRFLLKLTGVKVEKTTSVHRRLKLTSLGGRIKVGNNCTINRDVFIDNRMNVLIGNNVTIAHESSIYTLGHDIDHPDFSTKGRCVEIKDNAVLFAGSKIMPGVTIGRNSVILPYSVVTKSVPTNEVWGGNPAAKVRSRKTNSFTYSARYPFWLGN